jgi:hypothetical protein
MNKKLLYFLLVIIFIEFCLLWITADLYNEARLRAAVVASTTQEYRATNDMLYENAQKVLKKNEELSQANKSLSETLKKYCPECVIKQ